MWTSKFTFVHTTVYKYVVKTERKLHVFLEKSENLMANIDEKCGDCYFTSGID